EGEHRQVRGQLSQSELGLRPAHLEGGSQATVFILRLAIAASRQQAGVDPPAATIELDAEHANGINAEANRPLGVTGIDSQDKTLRPFFGLRLLIGADDIGEIPTEIVVARLQRRRGALNETLRFSSAGRRYNQAGSDEQVRKI